MKGSENNTLYTNTYAFNCSAVRENRLQLTYRSDSLSGITCHKLIYYVRQLGNIATADPVKVDLKISLSDLMSGSTSTSNK